MAWLTFLAGFTLGTIFTRIEWLEDLDDLEEELYFDFELGPDDCPPHGIRRPNLPRRCR